VRTTRADFQKQLVRALEAMHRATEAIATCIRMALDLELLADEETRAPTIPPPPRATEPPPAAKPKGPAPSRYPTRFQPAATPEAFAAEVRARIVDAVTDADRENVRSTIRRARESSFISGELADQLEHDAR